MANILEQGRRGDLPRLVDGHVHVGQRYADHGQHALRTERRRSSLMYFVEVTKFHPAKYDAPFRTEAYSMQFTEDEMIAITSEWLTMMNRRRIDAENEARKQAERAACLSKTSQPSSD